MNLKDLIAEGKNKILEGESLELAHIVRAEGSTPRGDDAYMFIDRNAAVIGTVGGGNVEYQASLYGAELLRSGQSGRRRYSLTRTDEESGFESKDEGRSPSGDEGRAGSCQEGTDLIKLGMICGGDVDIEFTFLPASDSAEKARSEAYIEELGRKILSAPGRVIIFGAGHVAESTVRVLDFAGFPCIVYDDREEFARKERFPQAAEVINAPYKDVLSRVDVSERDYVLIMTKGHHYDYEVQKQILNTDACFIGVIGSRAKHRAINEKLRQDGFTDRDIARFYGPVGLQIAAETPEEIAISIAAELILVRSYREERRKTKNGSALRLEDIRSGI